MPIDIFNHILKWINRMLKFIERNFERICFVKHICAWWIAVIALHRLKFNWKENFMLTELTVVLTHSNSQQSTSHPWPCSLKSCLNRCCFSADETDGKSNACESHPSSIPTYKPVVDNCLYSSPMEWCTFVAQMVSLELARSKTNA